MFTPSEQQEFFGLFENFVVLTYSERLLEYADGGGGLRAISSRPERQSSPASSPAKAAFERDTAKRFIRSGSIGA